jgi:hypothetical protein
MIRFERVVEPRWLKHEGHLAALICLSLLPAPSHHRNGLSLLRPFGRVGSLPGQCRVQRIRDLRAIIISKFV